MLAPPEITVDGRRASRKCTRHQCRCPSDTRPRFCSRSLTPHPSIIPLARSCTWGSRYRCSGLRMLFAASRRWATPARLLGRRAPQRFASRSNAIGSSIPSSSINQSISDSRYVTGSAPALRLIGHFINQSLRVLVMFSWIYSRQARKARQGSSREIPSMVQWRSLRGNFRSGFKLREPKKATNNNDAVIVAKPPISALLGTELVVLGTAASRGPRVRERLCKTC